MRGPSVEQVLDDLSAGQWGLFTAAQARLRGVERSNLAHRERDGRLERLRQGVYRRAGTPSGPLDDLRAAWLSTLPAKLAFDRVTKPDVVVGSAAAAVVHGIGDIDPAPYRFYASGRRQSQRDDIAYSLRSVDERDVSIRGGLPVTSVERTISDLLRDYGDLSLAADALDDALRVSDIDEQHLAALLSPIAARYGHAERDGRALLDQLLTEAGQDPRSRAIAALRNPALVSGIGDLLRGRSSGVAPADPVAAAIGAAVHSDEGPRRVEGSVE